jgi:hypothetical protein
MTFPNETKIDEEMTNEILNRTWIIPSKALQFCEEYCLVKVHGVELRVKEKTIKALKLLTYGFRFQKDAKVLPTKEEFLLACGISSERNGREFKILKELFPYPELNALVKFDRKRKGYYLCLDLSEKL